MVQIAKVLAEKGYRAYAVGGCVRDSIMGREPSDWDMTTDATPERMIEIFGAAGLHYIPTGLKHGTVTVMINKKPFEITTFRIDGSYTDSRRPDKVEFSANISEDLCRRDFTVNAMAADPLSDDVASEIVDLFGGACDVDKKIIRCVGDPEKRFSEDALRILRALRFATVLDFEIDRETFDAAVKLSGRLEEISAERKSVELEKILLSEHADRGVALLLETEIAKYIHHEIKAPEIALSTLPKLFSVRLAALLLQNGKPNVSKMKLSNERRDQICLLADNTVYDNCRSYFGNNIAANARMTIAKYGNLASSAALLRGDDNFARMIDEESTKNPATKISGLKVDGNTLMSAGIEQKKLGGIFSTLLERAIENPEINDREKLIRLAAELCGLTTEQK